MVSMIVKVPITFMCTLNVDISRLNVKTPVETQSAFGDSEFCRRCCTGNSSVPVWLIGSASQSIKVNSFLDDGSDSTYVRDDTVTALGLKTDEQTLRFTTLTESCVSLKSKKVSL